MGKIYNFLTDVLKTIEIREIFEKILSNTNKISGKFWAIFLPRQ